jgi:hypothetical protein
LPRSKKASWEAMPAQTANHLPDANRELTDEERKKSAQIESNLFPALLGGE